MVNDANEVETVEVELKVRTCDAPPADGGRHKAVALDGPGTACPEARCNGKIWYYNGEAKRVEVRKDALDDIADSEIIDVLD